MIRADVYICIARQIVSDIREQQRHLMGMYIPRETSSRSEKSRCSENKDGVVESSQVSDRKPLSTKTRTDRVEDATDEKIIKELLRMEDCGEVSVDGRIEKESLQPRTP